MIDSRKMFYRLIGRFITEKFLCGGFKGVLRSV